MVQADAPAVGRAHGAGGEDVSTMAPSTRLVAIPVAMALVAFAAVSTAGAAVLAQSRRPAATVVVRAPIARATAVVGDKIMVDLRACAASCGYTWKVTRRPAASVAKYVSTAYMHPSATKGSVGGTEIEEVAFRAVGAGSTTILLKYFPPGRNAKPAKSYELKLRVT
jgi:predicted secreted protein